MPSLNDADLAGSMFISHAVMLADLQGTFNAAIYAYHDSRQWSTTRRPHVSKMQTPVHPNVVSGRQVLHVKVELHLP